ncbi:MAG: hypothetical protein U0T83_07350 [Bacteriovoracaceae bacterium]
MKNVALKINKKENLPFVAKAGTKEVKNHPVSSKSVSLVTANNSSQPEPVRKNVVYDITQNDINKNKEQSIFKIISNRMLKKGVELEIFSSDAKK